MAKLTSPRVSVTFTELGRTAIRRGEKGTVALIVRDEAEQAPFAITQEGQIPAALGKESRAYIARTFLGYVNPPRKVIVYVAGKEDELTDALDYMAAQSFDYLCGPQGCTKAEGEAIAAWVKAQRKDNGAGFKAVLPNCAADHCAIVNFTGDGMTDGATVWTTAEYCSRIAGLLAGTPMNISATYAPLPELSDCARLTRQESDTAVGGGELILRWDGRKVTLGRAVTSLTTVGTAQETTKSFRKIKLVELTDRIRADITGTAEDEYVGKYSNSYDHKMLLATAIRSYLMELERAELVQPGYTVDLDLEAQAEYLTDEGVADVDALDEQALREANTGSHVFLLVTARLLDAIEDIAVNVEI